MADAARAIDHGDQLAHSGKDALGTQDIGWNGVGFHAVNHIH
jgi:hypothetical protein